MIAVLFLLAVASVASAQDCFEFTGAVAVDGFSAELGSTIELTWTTKETEECADITPETRVLVELWDEDTFFDDKLVVLSSSGEGNEGIANSGSFSWSVPFETTELNKLAGSSSFFGGETQLYFKVVVKANDDIESKTNSFKINEAGASIAVPALDAVKYVTGSSFTFTVKSIKLPSRLIKCWVRERGFAFNNQVLVAEFTTAAGGALQERTFDWRVESSLDTDTHLIACETADGLEPKATFVSPPDRDFQIVKQNLDFKITAPLGSQTVTANTDLVVKWTHTTGIASNEKVRVDLMEQSIFGSIFDRSIASTGDEGAVAPDAGKVTITVPPGAVGVYYVVATVVTNRAITITSELFEVLAAEKGCTLVAPLSSQALVAGAEVVVKYKCSGFTEDAVGKAELVNQNTYGDSTTYEIAAAASLASGMDHEIKYDLSSNVQPGWAWHLRITHDDGDMSSRPFLVANDNAEHCAASGSSIKCDPAAAKPYVAVTTNHDLELQNFELDFTGVACGSKYANFKVKSTVRLRGVSATFTQPISIYAGQPVVGFPMFGEAGDNVANEFILLVSDVVYPETRDSVSFKLALEQAPDLANLPLGTVTLGALGGLPANCDGAVNTDVPANTATAEAHTKPATVTTRSAGAHATVPKTTTAASGGTTTVAGPQPDGSSSASAVTLAAGALVAAAAMLA